jgi:hypothetical protein
MINKTFISFIFVMFLSGCSIVVVNSEKTNTFNTLDNKPKQVETIEKKEPCILENSEIQDTPKIPLEKITNSSSSYKDKTFILVDYLTELRTYVQQIKKDFRAYQLKVEEKCQK